MKFSIGHRLFIAVLLAIVAVTAAGLLYMRDNVMRSFSNYAVKIELDRLQGLTESLQTRYSERRSWIFIPENASERAGWVRGELERLSDKKLMSAELQAQRAQSLLQLESAQTQIRAAQNQIETTLQQETALLRDAKNPDANGGDQVRYAQEQLRIARERRYAAKAQVLAAKEDVLTAQEQIQKIERALPQIGALEDLAAVPAASPATPATPASPAAPAAPAAAVAPVLPAPHTGGAPGALAADKLSLQDRITLLDRDQRYLAGRVLDGKETVQRAIMAKGETAGYLLVAKTTGPSDALASEFVAEQKHYLILVALASVVLSAGAAMLLAAHFRRPIQTLVDGARLLAKGRFDTRMAIARSDELGELAASFNQLASKLERTEHSRRQWVADTSHELRTPLSVLRAQIEAMQDGIRSATPEHVATMLRQVMSLSKLVDELYELARADEGHFDFQIADVDMWQLVREEAAGFSEKIEAAGLSLRFGPKPRAAPLRCDSDRIRQVFANLFENSVRYSAPGGEIAVSATATASRLYIMVDDTAPAVPDEALQRLSERFFRVETSRNRQQGGSGLGLAMCQRIIEGHGGTLEFSHSPLGGLQVTVVFVLEQT